MRLFALALASLMALYGLYIFAAYGDFRRWSGWEDIERRAYLAFGHTVANGAGIAFSGHRRPPRFGQAGAAPCSSPPRPCSSSSVAAAASFLGVALAALVGLAARPPSAFRGRIELPRNTAVAFLLLAAAAHIAYLVASGDDDARPLRQAREPSRGHDRGPGPNRFEYWAAPGGLGSRRRSSATASTASRSCSAAGASSKAATRTTSCPDPGRAGLVGLFLFGLFVWLAARHASFRQLRHDPLMVRALLFVITSAMSALFGRDIVDVRKFFSALSLLALRPPVAASERARQVASNWRRTPRRGARWTWRGDGWAPRPPPRSPASAASWLWP